MKGLYVLPQLRAPQLALLLQELLQLRVSDLLGSLVGPVATPLACLHHAIGILAPALQPLAPHGPGTSRALASLGWALLLLIITAVQLPWVRLVADIRVRVIHDPGTWEQHGCAVGAAVHQSRGPHAGAWELNATVTAADAGKSLYTCSQTEQIVDVLTAPT